MALPVLPVPPPPAAAAPAAVVPTAATEVEGPAPAPLLLSPRVAVEKNLALASSTDSVLSSFNLFSLASNSATASSPPSAVRTSPSNSHVHSAYGRPRLLFG